MAGRITVLADERIETLRPFITERVSELAKLVSTDSFGSFFDGTMRAVLLETFRSVGAHEGSIWLLDEARRHLIPRFNNGPRAEGWVNVFEQPLQAGMISAVVSTELPICENAVHKNVHQDRTLDDKLQHRTCAMLAVPLYFAGELRGVVSAVQLQSLEAAAPEPPGFEPQHLDALELSAAILSKLVDQHLLTVALGLEDYG